MRISTIVKVCKSTSFSKERKEKRRLIIILVSLNLLLFRERIEKTKYFGIFICFIFYFLVIKNKFKKSMANRQLSKRNRWAIDFTSPAKGVLTKPKPKDQLSMVGFSEQKVNAVVGGQSTDSKLISKRSWNISLAPMKQLPMNLFIMYMSGSSISIFPIMIVGMMIFRPIKAMMAYKATFKMLDADSKAILLKLVWLLGNCLGIVIAVWKCHSMGLLPTSPSDWLAFKEHRQRVEYVIGGMTM